MFGKVRKALSGNDEVQGPDRWFTARLSRSRLSCSLMVRSDCNTTTYTYPRDSRPILDLVVEVVFGTYQFRVIVPCLSISPAKR